MTKKYQRCIIFFGEDWGRLNSTAQYLANAMVNNHQIIWINSLGLREPEFNLGDLKRIFVKLFATVSSLFKNKKIETNLSKGNDLLVLSPIAIPYLKFKLIRFINRKLIMKYLHNFLKPYDVSQAYLISACPATADIVRDIRAKKIIYYCADQYYAQPGMNKTLVTELENKLIVASDLVVVTSRALIGEKQELARNIQYLPHGVNYAHLSKALKNNYSIPDDIRNLETPLIGYVGSIGNHLNFDFIKHVASNINKGSIIMIGPVEDDVMTLPKHDRIKYLGMKNYEQLPAYIQNFTVCIMPWNEQSERIKYAHPTKLREYLAAGVPVVSLAHSEVEGVSEYILTCNTKEGFLGNINKVLDSQYDRTAISNSMRNEDWSNRARTLLDYIEAIN